MEVSTLSKRYIQRTWGCIFSFVLVMSAMNNVHAQTQLAAWSFPTTDAAPNTPTSFLSEFGEQENTAAIYADGTNGSSTFVQTGSNPELTMFAGSTVNDPKSSPSNTGALTLANQSANGKSIVIKFSMTGYENPVLTYATRGTASGFTTHTWEYSTDGVTFTQVKVITGRTNTNFTTQEVDLTDEDGVDNAATVYLRVTVTGASSTSGNNRFDNIQIHADEATASNPPVVTSDMYFEEVGVATSIQIEASNPPITGYALATGSSLPAGLALNTTTGEIYGTPTTAGYYEFDVNATNSAGTSADATIAIDISAGNQTISFGALSDVTYGDPDFNLSASATSGLPVTFYSSNPLVATVSGNTVTIVGAGTTTITATQEGDANWYSAANVPQSLTVNKADQTITFEALASKLDNDAPFQLTATASSGLTLTYTSSNPAVATVSGDMVTIVGPGTTTITASQAGDNNYNAAVSVQQDLLVVNSSLLTQTITFGSLSDVTYGDASFPLTATASSGLNVSYTSSNPAVATVSGDIVTIVGVGTTTITASQAGNGTYNPADDVTQTLTVLPKTLTLTGVVAENKVYDGTTTVSLDLTNASLNGVVSGDDVTFSVNGAFADENANDDVEVNVSVTLNGADIDNYTISNSLVLYADITPAPQSITFGSIPTKVVTDAPFNLSATASSGLAVTYTSSNPSVATVSGNTVTIVGAGNTTISASQAGNQNYQAATTVNQVLTVVNVPVIATYNFTDATANPASVPTGMTLTAISKANENGSATLLSTAAPSTGAGSSGTYNIGLATINGALNVNSSSYFEFTATAALGKQITIPKIEFGSRSTSTGPKNVSIHSSMDDYETSLGNVTVTTNSSWAKYSITLSTPLVIANNESVTIRLYGYNGSGANLNTVVWRVDDIDITSMIDDVCPGAPATPVIQGVENVCPFLSTLEEVTYSVVDPIPNATYNWVVPVGTTLVSGQGTSSITLLIDMELSNRANKQIRVSATNDCGTSAQAIFYLKTHAPSTPKPISGPIDACGYVGGATLATYSVEEVIAATEYLWVLPMGMTIVNNNGNSIDVEISDTYITSSMQVYALNGCGVSEARSITVTKTNPSTPGLIKGSNSACMFMPTSNYPEGSIATYSVAEVSGSTYQWTVPAGLTILDQYSLNGMNHIDVEYSPSFVSGNITVKAQNGCGVSGNRSLALSKLRPSAPDIIDQVLVEDCPNRIYSYSLPVMPGNTVELKWSTPVDATIISGQGTNTIIVSYPPTAIEGEVSVYGENGCYTSSVRKMKVKLTACTTPEYTRFAIISGTAVEAIDVTVFPNPTYQNFRVKVAAAAKGKVMVNVTDITGRSVTKLSARAGELIEFGHNFKAGTYFVEVIQGNERKVVKVVKL